MSHSWVGSCTLQDVNSCREPCTSLTTCSLVPGVIESLLDAVNNRLLLTLQRVVNMTDACSSHVFVYTQG